MVVEPLSGPWQLTELSPQTAETDRNPGPPSRCAGVVRQTLRKRFQPAEFDGGNWRWSGRTAMTADGTCVRLRQALRNGSSSNGPRAAEGIGGRAIGRMSSRLPATERNSPAWRITMRSRCSCTSLSWAVVFTSNSMWTLGLPQAKGGVIGVQGSKGPETIRPTIWSMANGRQTKGKGTRCDHRNVAFSGEVV